MLLSFAYAHSDWKRSMMFYLAAFTGDLFDGMAARYFDQCEWLSVSVMFIEVIDVDGCCYNGVIGSQLGGILDMVTDRVSTAGLLMILSQLYPNYHFGFNALMCIDIFSHWFHVMRYFILLFTVNVLTFTVCILVALLVADTIKQNPH